jgi:hypothetical protein
MFVGKEITNHALNVECMFTKFKDATMSIVSVRFSVLIVCLLCNAVCRTAMCWQTGKKRSECGGGHNCH